MQLDKLQSYFAKQGDVRLAYLFGSHAKNREGPLSDIDIAVFLDKKLGKSERQKRKLDLINKISSILKTDRIDLVIMNNCPTSLNYEIIKHGRILHMKDVEEKVDVESSILSRYLDRRYYDQRNLNAFLEKTIERGGL
nr:nucleotidyltransferase domain-containing protein [Candidatus Njordarchaeota archaeon]